MAAPMDHTEKVDLPLDSPEGAMRHLEKAIHGAWENGISGICVAPGQAPVCRQARSFLPLEKLIGSNTEKAQAARKLLGTKLDVKFFEALRQHWVANGLLKDGEVTMTQISVDGDRYWRARINVVPYNFANGTPRPSKQLFLLEIRVLEHTAPDFSELPYPAPFFDGVAGRPSGIVLIGGLASSGRSTTMASLVLKLAQTQSGLNIATLESPIEYVLRRQSLGGAETRVVQAEIAGTREAWFQEMSSVLRRDFNVVVASDVHPALPSGEVLDLSDIFFEMAGNGARVFSAISGVDFWDVFERFTHRTDPVAERVAREAALRHLNGIIVQQLVSVYDHTQNFYLTELHGACMLFTDQVRGTLMTAFDNKTDDQLRKAFANFNRGQMNEGSRSIVESMEALRTRGVDPSQLFLGVGTVRGEQ